MFDVPDQQINVLELISSFDEFEKMMESQEVYSRARFGIFSSLWSSIKLFSTDLEKYKGKTTK